jgi:predicted DNA-binding transcriptional regulator YafY
MAEPNRSVYILYTNHRGERAVRHIQPLEVFFGVSEYHTERQWLLFAYDIDKKDMRNFAMRDIHMWSPSLIATPADQSKGT